MNRTLHKPILAIRRCLHYNAEVEKQMTQWLHSAHGKIVAKRVLEIVPPSFTDTSTFADYTDKVYMSESDILRHPQKHMLSQLTTFPLTLAHSIHRVFPLTNQEALFDEFRVTVVGGRAESTLPLQWWRHALFQRPFTKELSLRFIGPGIGFNSTVKGGESTATWTWTTSSHNNRINIKSDIIRDAKLLHEHEDLHKILLQTHMFVLYNPGLGSPSLKEKWKPTIELLLAARKPVLCTALNPSDLNADLAALQAAASTRIDDEDLGESFEMICKPQNNPFASSLVRLDEEQQPVTTNHSFYVFQSK